MTVERNGIREIIAELLPGYETRPTYTDLRQAVLEVLANKHLVPYIPICDDNGDPVYDVPDPRDRMFHGIIEAVDSNTDLLFASVAQPYSPKTS